MSVSLLAFAVPCLDRLEYPPFLTSSLRSHDARKPLRLGQVASSYSDPDLHWAAILFLSSLSLCFACSSNLSTAYFNRSFFCLNLFNSPAFSPPSPRLNFKAELVLGPVEEGRRPCDKRPSCNSDLALRASSRRAILSMWFDARDKRWVMLGVISSRRDCCASRRVGSGSSSKC